MSAAALVLEAVQRAPATLRGRCRVVTVDGPAAAGKTTLAESLLDGWLRSDGQGGHRPEPAAVVHMDDLYDGWRGVLSVCGQVHALLCSLRDDGVATYRRYDWHLAAYAEEHRVVLPRLLVLEGVGSSAAAYDDLLSLRVWVEAPRDVRLARGLARDGAHLREQWLRFLADEEHVHARERTRERADLVVDGVTGTVGSVSPVDSGARDRRGRR